MAEQAKEKKAPAVNAEQKQKLDALTQAIAHLEKQYGKGAVMKLGGETRVDIPCISTGSLSLDIALGGRGVPKGRVIEIFGPEASGKTTLSLHIVANAQKNGGTAAFIDVEHALDPTYAEKIGVNLVDLVISQPDSGEQALNTAETLVRSNAVDIVVVDSVAALVPQAEIEGNIGDAHVGLQARLMSQALRKLTAIISKSNTCVIFINQLREKIGISWGNPETTPGGRALKFYASVRLDVRKIGSLKNSAEEVIGTHVKVSVVKNKVAPPFRKVELDIMHSGGISYVGDVLDMAVTAEIVKKSGAWMEYKGNRIGQGREKTKDYLKENSPVMKEIEAEVKKLHGLA
ncbi:MAG: recombinase RecA [Planctomycetota bacterium]